MSLTEAFARVDAPAMFARMFKRTSPASADPAAYLSGEGVTARVGDVLVARSGAANDLSDAANDAGRPHIAARRADRRDRREVRGF